MEKFWNTPHERLTRSEGEWNELPSQTVPGQSKTIEEMLKRVDQGFQWEKNDLDYTDEDDPLPIIKDLTDVDKVHTFIHNVRQQRQIQKNKQNALGQSKEKEGSEGRTANTSENAE